MTEHQDDFVDPTEGMDDYLDAHDMHQWALGNHGAEWAAHRCTKCGAKTITTAQAVVIDFGHGHAALYEPKMRCGIVPGFATQDAAVAWCYKLDAKQQWLVSQGTGEDDWTVELVEGQSC
jgi:hypothetical protein